MVLSKDLPTESVAELLVGLDIVRNRNKVKKVKNYHAWEKEF